MMKSESQEVINYLEQQKAEISQLRAELEAERKKSATLVSKRDEALHLVDAKSNLLANIVDTLRSRGFPASLLHPADVRVIELATSRDNAITALRQCVEALEECSDAVLADWLLKQINEAITAAKEALK